MLATGMQKGAKTAQKKRENNRLSGNQGALTVWSAQALRMSYKHISFKILSFSK